MATFLCFTNITHSFSFSNGVTCRPFQFPLPLPALPLAETKHFTHRQFLCKALTGWQEYDPLAETKHFTHRQFLCKALTGWQEYEDAVKNKDLARALRFLKNVSAVPDESPIELTQTRVDAGGLGLIGLDRNWEVLDTCLNADDMRLVGSAYGFLQTRGFLPNFGKYRSIAYLMGCPIRGVILDPIVAMQMGIQGQAGTQFWDEKLQNELAEGRLSGTAFDRYSMVLFAGIAAEALVYGEAEGGENDENLFRNICLLLDPPLVVAQMSNQARWSVLQSYNMLKWHKHAHRAAVKALESGGSLSMRDYCVHALRMELLCNLVVYY
ncbi:hypothetical protein RJ640_005054 [Escallonia rubra]|uniref:Uncharacterized protein n=1 Tax=Escallonia rubra TaxID=112253 RepID=A0AA88QJU5_9ASTE|nr:hypothetical protein RJ640_005054 [Escallonia rubra]